MNPLVVAASSDPSLAELLPRLFGSMVVVILAMWGAARLLKNRKIPGTGGLRMGTVGSAKKQLPVEVLSRHSLGRHASVALVRTGDKTLVLGVTDQNVSLLTQIDEVTLDEPQELDVQRTDVEQPAWTGLLTQVRDLTTRR